MIAKFFDFTAFIISLHSAWQRNSSERRILSSKIKDYSELKDSLLSTYKQMPEPKNWVQTSGTSGHPKYFPYDQKRKNFVQKIFLKAMIVLTSQLKGKKTFFLISSLEKDGSLTAGLVHNSHTPSFVELLQAPYRYFETKRGQNLCEKYGLVFSRYVILLITRPRIIYATNPSTITHFFKQLEGEWEDIRKALGELLQSPEELKPLLQLAEGDALGRLQQAHQQDTPQIDPIIETLNAFISWDGGYVGLFVKQLKKKFPRIQHIPMFSMSTEVIETFPHIIKNRLYFLPTIAGIYYEFYDPQDQNIYQKDELVVGKSYVLIVTDKWGLERYNTKDIFLVKQMVDGLPDLAFIKRSEITASVTGEKITETQVRILYESLRKKFEFLKDASLSMYPREVDDYVHYELIVIANTQNNTQLIASAAEKILQEINIEYKTKVDSGRLHPLKVKFGNEGDLAFLFGKEKNWESQFKIMPLYANIIRTN